MALTVLGVVIISWPRREAPAVPAVRVERGWATFLRQHRPFVVVELLVLGAALTLDVIVTLHPAPLPGDVGSVLDLQRLLLPHKALTLWLGQVSTVTWPITALETILAAVALLLLLHRWLDALLVAVLTGLGSGSSYLTSLLIQRPRPAGHGIYVLWHMVLVTVIVVIGPSRILEGEHWLSDVVAGYLYGAFWLLLGIYVYGWAARRWPRLLGSGEQKSATA
jgi:membrane-associated phospholipid phosphatase